MLKAAHGDTGQVQDIVGGGLREWYGGEVCVCLQSSVRSSGKSA